MKLKFSKTTAIGGSRSHYQAGKEYEVKDAHAAEVYIAHGYATAVEGTTTGETLKRAYPVRASEPAKAETAKSETKK